MEDAVLLSSSLRCCRATPREQMKPMAGKDGQMNGRLRARPVRVTGAAPVGLQPLVLGAARDSYLYVPATYRVERPVPLVLLLHGAGGHARQGLDLLRSLADAAELLLLAPASREHTWDLLVGRRYGPDLALIDRALERTFSRYAVAPERVAVGGFSDGASYALSLGITNGDLFTHVIAFSPGFVAPAGRPGSPRIFVSHGRHDKVLPIDLCSRRIVPRLGRAGYDVQYREFDGGHTISPETALEAVGWFTQEKFP
jgi:phospholipase/carboxylesterase